jgi:ParB-like nuclease domain
VALLTPAFTLWALLIPALPFVVPSSEVSLLRPYQHNARTHSKRQIEQIARSIERFGFLNPVLIDASGTIIERLLPGKRPGA